MPTALKFIFEKLRKSKKPSSIENPNPHIEIDVLYKEYLDFADRINDPGMRLTKYEFEVFIFRVFPGIERSYDGCFMLVPIDDRRKDFEKFTGMEFNW